MGNSKRACCILSFFLFISFANPILSRVDFFTTGQAIGLGVMADSLYLGASFIYQDSSKVVEVAFVNTDAHFEGRLYFMVPGFTDSAYYLFTNKPENHPTDPTRVNLTNLFDIPVGSKIYFMYKVGNYSPKYTGENIDGVDLYVSRESHFYQGERDHRWATAGRINDNTGAPTDSADFTFEDDPNGDLDCDDIIFRVTGLGLNIEEQIPEIDSTVVFDAVGNGIADSLVIYFKQNIDTALIKGIDLLWPQGGTSFSLDLFSLALETPRIVSLPFQMPTPTIATSGTGRTSITFDSLGVNTTKEADAKDGIGPLLKTPALLVQRYAPGNDTFYVALTEAVAVSEIMNRAFVLIKKDTQREIELTLLDPATDLGGGDSLMFAIGNLGNDAPESGDSLKILSTGPVKDDPRGNRAHKDNTPVPINLIDRPVSVEVVKGYYFDRTADGYVDSLFIEIATDIPGGLTSGLLDELVQNALSLPSFRDFTIERYALSGRGFYLLVSESKQHAPQTYVSSADIITISAYTLSNSATVTAGTAIIIDRVAPIIHWQPRSAVLHDYHVASKNDTLTVKFSEPIQNVSSEEPFYFYATASSSSYSVRLRPLNQPTIDGMTFEVTTVSGVSDIVDGDSLWIQGVDRVVDTVGNGQNNPQNSKRRIYVEKIFGTVTLNRGYYYDLNADGYVDSIPIAVTTDIEGGLTRVMAEEIAEKALALPDFRDFSQTKVGLVSGGYYLLVSEEQSHNPQTSVTNEDKLTVMEHFLPGGGKVVAGTVPIFDKVAPIIRWDRGDAQAIIHLDGETDDSLIVTFTEPVKYVNAQIPFYFKVRGNGATYTGELETLEQPDPNKMIFEIKGCSHNKAIAPGDSIWIHEHDRVGDLCKNEQGNNTTNYQNNRSNTRREIVVLKRLLPFTLIPRAVTPVSVGNITQEGYKIPNRFFNFLDRSDLNLTEQGGNSYGMIIMVSPDNEENVFDGFKLQAQVTILDALGNKVVSGKEMGWDASRKRLVWVWNLKNHNGRFIGSSAYVCLIDIQEISQGPDRLGINETKKIVLGVQ